MRNASVGAGASGGQSLKSKAGGTTSQQAAVHPWLATDAHVNKQNKKNGCGRKLGDCMKKMTAYMFLYTCRGVQKRNRYCLCVLNSLRTFKKNPSLFTLFIALPTPRELCYKNRVWHMNNDVASEVLTGGGGEYKHCCVL
jgi:hypothetical protein